MRTRLRRCTTAAIIFLSSTTSATALTLSGTIFDEAGSHAGLDPKLLYAVALAESAFGRGSGLLGPYPWTLRSDHKVLYAQSREEAERELRSHIQKHGRVIDVGLMQVNLRWHGEKVSDPADLLDPRTNLKIASQYLAKMIVDTPSDLELAIGKYHVGPVTTEKNIARARNYGSRVIAIYRNLVSLVSGGRP